VKTTIQNDAKLNELTDSAQILMESNTAIPSEMIDQMKAHQNEIAHEIAVKYEQYNTILQNNRNSDSEQKIDRLSKLAEPKLKKKVLVPKAKQNLTMRKLN
jgi:23S rRNA A1618 N6-methylase RlmF